MSPASQLDTEDDLVTMQFDRVVALAATLSVIPSSDVAAQGSPSLVSRDSIVLEENDSVFVALVGGFAVSSKGQLFISDRRNFNVIEFSPRGKIVRTFGRRGRGPGEFNDPGAIALDGDSILIVYGSPNLHAFDLQTGKLKWQRLPGAKMTQVLSTHRGRIIQNAVIGRDPSLRVSLAAVRSAHDSAEFGGPFPSPLGQAPHADQMWGYLQMTLWSADSVAVAITAASDWIFVGRFSSLKYDSVRVARVSRRGGPSGELLRRLVNEPASMTQEELFRPSAPWALGKLSSGNFAYVTFDATPINQRITGTIRASVVDPRAKRSCSDAEIPVPTDPQPRALFRGDTLFVLSQDETADRKPRAIVRRFMLQTGSCRWVS
jgi:hypothetical protein